MPEDADVLNSLGLALTGLGRLDEAIDLFRRAEDLGGDSTVYASHIDALRDLGRSRKASTVARAAVAKGSRRTHRRTTCWDSAGHAGGLDARSRSFGMR